MAITTHGHTTSCQNTHKEAEISPFLKIDSESFLSAISIKHIDPANIQYTSSRLLFDLGT
jgi:hypothetical protein